MSNAKITLEKVWLRQNEAKGITEKRMVINFQVTDSADGTKKKKKKDKCKEKHTQAHHCKTVKTQDKEENLKTAREKKYYQKGKKERLHKNKKQKKNQTTHLTLQQK